MSVLAREVDWRGLRRVAPRWRRYLPVLEKMLGKAVKAEGSELAGALAVVEPAGRVLVEALARSEVEVACRAVRDLAGLGVGSTPLGDDYLVGVFHALWAAGDEQTAALLAAEAVPRTTTVSAYWLRATASGLAGPAWSRLLRLLAAPNADTLSVQKASVAVLASGQTSGVASLLGFFLATQRMTADLRYEATLNAAASSCEGEERRHEARRYPPVQRRP